MRTAKTTINGRGENEQDRRKRNDTDLCQYRCRSRHHIPGNGDSAEHERSSQRDEQTYEAMRISIENPDVREAFIAAQRNNMSDDQRQIMDFVYAAGLRIRQNRYLQTCRTEGIRRGIVAGGSSLTLKARFLIQVRNVRSWPNRALASMRSDPI